MSNVLLVQARLRVVIDAIRERRHAHVEKLFSETEASDIIRRTAEIADASSLDQFTPSLTRSDLYRIAFELGLPQDALDQAIREPRLPRIAAPRFGFAPFVERVFRFDASIEEFAVVFDLLPSGQSHSRSIQPRRVEYTTWCGVMAVRVSASSRYGMTRVQLSGSYWVLALGAGIPVLLGGAILGNAVNWPLAFVVSLLVFVAFLKFGVDISDPVFRDLDELMKLEMDEAAHQANLNQAYSQLHLTDRT